MKTFIGGIMIVSGIALGLYVGVYLCFIGGIIDVITEIRAEDLSAYNTAIGIAKVVFSGLIGTLAGYCLLIPGYAILVTD